MDINLRLNKEMLVLSSPAEAGLSRLGIDREHDLAAANIFEKETIKNALSAYVIAGAQCLVANTKQILTSKLAHDNLDNRINEIAKAAIEIAFDCKPQHVIVEMGNCGLPLDDMSKNSLNEFKDQYVCAGRVFENIASDPNYNFDAYMLSELKTIPQLKCALMGVKQITDKPIIVSVCLDSEGNIDSKYNIYDYAKMLSEFGATVAGIKVKDNLDIASKLCKRLRAGCDLPILVELEVNDDKNCPYKNADTMKQACLSLNKSGAQFLRATGFASPAYTAVLAGVSSQMPLNLRIGV